MRNQRPPGGGRPSLYRSMIDLRTRHPSSDCVVDPGPGCRGRALRATRNTREDIITVATTPCQLPVLRSRPWSFLVIPAFPAVVPPATRSRTLIVKRLGRLREATRPRSIAASPPVHLFSEGQKIRPGTGVLRAGGRDATRPSQNCVLTFAKPPTHGPGTWDEKGRGRKSTTLPMTPSRLAPGRAAPGSCPRMPSPVSWTSRTAAGCARNSLQKLLRLSVRHVWGQLCCEQGA